MFYFFNEREGPDAHVMHVHFGMSGRFSTHDALSCPDPTATTRLRLEHREDGIVALLSAMTVDLMDESGYHLKRSKLGQDPLREDADPDALWDKFRSARKSVGLALMDQAMFAGVGNIYRAEILYKAGVHPEQPCADLDRAQFDVVWRHTVELLQRGFVNGSILTVDPEEAAILGDPWTRRYVYNQSRCGRCGAPSRRGTWRIEPSTVARRASRASRAPSCLRPRRNACAKPPRRTFRSCRTARRTVRRRRRRILQAHRRQAQGDPRRDGLARRGAQTRREKSGPRRVASRRHGDGEGGEDRRRRGDRSHGRGHRAENPGEAVEDDQRRVQVGSGAFAGDARWSRR